MTSPSLEKHSYYLEIIVEATTLAELSAIRTEYTLDPVLTEGQKGVLKSRYEIREMQLKALFTAQPGVGAPAFTNKERVAVTHAQDDAVAFATPAIADEVFPDIEITTVDTTTTNSTPNETPTTPAPTPAVSSEGTPVPSSPVVDKIEPVA